MSILFSPVLNDQQFDANGAPLAGGKIYTYLAGTTTPVTTYKTSTGTAHSNPIILDSSGNYTTGTQLWLDSGKYYKFVVKDANDVTLRTIDNISPINDVDATPDEWVRYTQTAISYISATSFSVAGDQTNTFQTNRRVKTTNTSGSVYGYISSAVYSAPNTLVTVVNDSGSLDSGLSEVYYSLLSATNPSIPQLPNWVKSSMIQDDAIAARHLADSSQGFVMTNGYLTASVSLNAMTIAVKTNAGTDPSTTDPVLVTFRNATLTNGTYVVVPIVAATSIVISNGSTLGTSNGVQSTIQVLLINNAGTVELAVVNNSGALQLTETSLISTTAEGGAGAADSADIFYSTTARSNVAYRNAGYIVSTQATAGTWASAPTQIQLYSGAPQSSQGAWIYFAEQASTSGTSIAFPTVGAIPSWATEIKVMFVGVSTNGTSDMILQIGDSGGIEATGYLGTCSALAGSATSTNFTTGYGLSASSAAANTYHGTITLSLEDASDNTWVCTSILARSDGAQTHLGGGSKSLSATLDRLLITTVGGVNTFDAGVIRACYR